MGQRFFSIGKVPVLLEGFASGIEKRKDDPETKVIVLTCTVSPFTAKHATAIDNGAKAEQNIRSTIFDQTGNAEPRPGFTGHEFSLGLPRQDFEMFAAPDSPEASIVLDHVKIKGACKVKIHKDNPNAMVLSFKAAVGPCSAKELAEIQKWNRTQKFVTFKESDPSIEFEEVGENDDEEDDAPDESQPELPAHEFETDADGRPLEAGEASNVEPINRPLHSHARSRKPNGKPNGRTTH